MKPYLITKSSFMLTNHYFINSFPKLEDSVEYISYQLEPYWNENPPNAKVIKLNQHFRYHADKFLNLDLSELDLNRWIIFCDTGDVIFQKPIPDLDDSKEIYVASENITHGGEVRYVPNGGGYWEQFFKTNGIFERFKSLMFKMIYNSGTFAMKGYLFKEFLDYFKSEIDNGMISITDQPIFNYWIHFIYKKPVSEYRELFMCAYKNIDLGLMKKEDDVWKTGDSIISICHFNGSYKKYL